MHEMNHGEILLCLHKEQLRPSIIQDMSYDYKKNDKHRQKEEQFTQKVLHEKKLAQKRRPSQLILRLFTKNIENLTKIKEL